MQRFLDTSRGSVAPDSFPPTLSSKYYVFLAAAVLLSFFIFRIWRKKRKSNVPKVEVDAELVRGPCAEGKTGPKNVDLAQSDNPEGEGKGPAIILQIANFPSMRIDLRDVYFDPATGDHHTDVEIKLKFDPGPNQSCPLPRVKVRVKNRKGHRQGEKVSHSGQKCLPPGVASCTDGDSSTASGLQYQPPTKVDKPRHSSHSSHERRCQNLPEMPWNMKKKKKKPRMKFERATQEDDLSLIRDSEMVSFSDKGEKSGDNVTFSGEKISTSDNSIPNGQIHFSNASFSGVVCSTPLTSSTETVSSKRSAKPVHHSQLITSQGENYSWSSCSCVSHPVREILSISSSSSDYCVLSKHGGKKIGIDKLGNKIIISNTRTKESNTLDENDELLGGVIKSEAPQEISEGHLSSELTENGKPGQSVSEVQDDAPCVNSDASKDIANIRKQSIIKYKRIINEKHEEEGPNIHLELFEGNKGNSNKKEARPLRKDEIQTLLRDYSLESANEVLENLPSSEKDVTITAKPVPYPQHTESQEENNSSSSFSCISQPFKDIILNYSSSYCNISDENDDVLGGVIKNETPQEISEDQLLSKLTQNGKPVQNVSEVQALSDDAACLNSDASKDIGNRIKQSIIEYERMINEKHEKEAPNIHPELFEGKKGNSNEEEPRPLRKNEIRTLLREHSLENANEVLKNLPSSEKDVSVTEKSIHMDGNNHSPSTSSLYGSIETASAKSFGGEAESTVDLDNRRQWHSVETRKNLVPLKRIQKRHVPSQLSDYSSNFLRVRTVNSLRKRKTKWIAKKSFSESIP